MNKIYLDMGNSRWKYYLDGQVLPYAYKDDSLKGMTEILQQQDMPAEFVIASVRNESLNDGLDDFLQAHGCRVRWVTWKDCQAIQTRYDNPAALGIDRYLNMLGALKAYTLPVIVVSAGTAVTVDALDESGRHLGGIVFPGKVTLSQSLVSNTDKINIDSMAENDTIFARNTSAAVNAGVAIGFISAVDGIVKQMLQELGDKTTVILTGGDAEYLADNDYGVPARIDDKLLFNALRALDEKN